MKGNSSRFTGLETTQKHHTQEISALREVTKEMFQVVRDIGKQVDRLPKPLGILIEVEGELVSAGTTAEYVFEKTTPVEINGKLSALTELLPGNQTVLSFSGQQLQRIIASTKPPPSPRQ